MSEPTRRRCDRDPITNCLALAAMPDLEEVAAPLAPKIGEQAALATVVYLGVRAAFGSHRTAASALLRTSLWDDMRSSAARVGRTLPRDAPTYDKLRHYRRKPGMAAVVEQVHEQLSVEAVALARSMGLLLPDAPCDPRRPARANTLVGDGTTFDKLNHPTDDGKGYWNKDVGLADQDEGHVEPDTVKLRLGMPVAVAAVRGDGPQSRVVVGAKVYEDKNELRASEVVRNRVLRAAGRGVHAYAYDRLMGDDLVVKLVRQGIVAVARMTQAEEKHPYVPSKVVTPRVRRPNAKRRNKGDRPEPKKRLRTYDLGEHVHTLDDGTRCTHHLWSVDGSLVVRDDDTFPATSDDMLAPTTLEWVGPGREQLAATYEVAGDCGTFDVAFDLCGDHDGKGLAGVLRPLPESDGYMWKVFGWREDIESLFSLLKSRAYRFGRASAVEVMAFSLDLVGCVLLENSVAWDVHVSHHTSAARHNAKLAAGRTAS